MTRYRSAALFGLLLTLATVANAQFTVDWFTVDGGGAMGTTGGSYELSGTIGQADANVVVMTGGEFDLTGGFWAVMRAATLPGDCDGDQDVDLADFADFSDCLGGPGQGLGADCDCYDLDDDGDVDLRDFAEFQTAFTGA
ncbi:MAG TPA: hypothetical protein PKK06_05435 [Phycisphaerae bacterium]|nr:hypothetical protein [Phycisphaerae bacterium]HNU44800.1 hypothetical protein [Phycisphaerae bacterium]